MSGGRPKPKMTIPTQLVLLALMEQPDQERYGLELSGLAGLAPGTVHPILARLEKAGWVRSRWEEIDPVEQGRPRRRYYRLDPDGIAFARAQLARASASTAAVRRLRPDLAGGAL